MWTTIRHYVGRREEFFLFQSSRLFHTGPSPSHAKKLLIRPPAEPNEFSSISQPRWVFCFRCSLFSNSFYRQTYAPREQWQPLPSASCLLSPTTCKASNHPAIGLTSCLVPTSVRSATRLSIGSSTRRGTFGLTLARNLTPASFLAARNASVAPMS